MSTNEYTPTTEYVRNCYVFADDQYVNTVATPVRVATAEFNRWLVGVVADARREERERIADLLAGDSLPYWFDPRDELIEWLRSGAEVKETGDRLHSDADNVSQVEPPVPSRVVVKESGIS